MGSFAFMKIKKLKSINIGGVDFKMKWEKDDASGSFSYKDKEIKIGTQLGDNYALRILIHELKEIIQVEQNTRYDRLDENQAFYFHYSHAEHTDLCGRLAEYLNKFI